MDLKLKDKVVVVTGAAGIAGSIGHTIVMALADEGATPVLVDRNDRGFGYAEELQKRKVNAKFYKTDLSDHEQIKASVSQIIEDYGRIDVVINNVGVNDGASLESDLDDFVYSLKLNLISFFAVVKYALPALKKSKGNILNIGSKVSLTGQGGTSGYAAAKGGVLGLTREWAVDLVDNGIRCNALIISESYTPAYENWITNFDDSAAKLQKIKDRIPLGKRMTQPGEIADTTLFLISERSSHTTGQIVFVDGGYVHLDRALHTNN